MESLKPTFPSTSPADSSRPSVYLAGPDVFYPDARLRGQAMCALCAEHGFEGLYPLDAPIDPGIQPKSRAIFEANKALIDRADAVVANLRDWRGHEPDSEAVCHQVHAVFGETTNWLGFDLQIHLRERRLFHIM